ncbi:MAG: putative ABC transporter permease [Syntrophomonadaceae bacterium]
MLVINGYSFASLDLAFYFVIYAFLGWIMESGYTWAEEGHFVNRGFLNGPFCPIYGFGSVWLIILLKPLLSNIPMLFTGAVLLTSTLEYATGFVLEKIFHEKWWDYSNRRFNLQGRICLRFSLYWGIGAVIMLKALHPEISRLVSRIPYDAGTVFIGVLAIYFAVDLIHTLRSVAQLRTVVEQIQLLRFEAQETIDLFKEASLEALEELREDIRARHEALIARAASGPRRLFKAFPNLGPGQHENLLRELRYRLIQKYGEK